MNSKRHARLQAALPTLVLLTLAHFAGPPPSWAQQNPPSLQINAPTAGTIANPGQTLTVSVSSPANVAFSAVAVIGQDPLPTSNVQSSIPGQFSITVPTDNS